MKKKIVISFLLFICLILSATLYYRQEIKRMSPFFLAKMPNKITRGILVKQLNDPDEEIVIHAAYRLGKIGDSTAYQPLVKAINHPVPMVRHNAINAMIELDQADLAADATIKSLRNINEESFVLDSAMELLRELKDEGNKEKAIKALREYAPRAEHDWDKSKAEKIIRMFEKERAPDKNQ